MPFKEGGSTRDMLLSSLMLEQYRSIRRYFARQSYVKAVQKHKKISLVQRHVLLSRPAQRHTLKDRTKSYISYSIAAGAKARTLIRVRSR
jgi:myosin heavy subunit